MPLTLDEAKSQATEKAKAELRKKINDNMSLNRPYMDFMMLQNEFYEAIEFHTIALMEENRND